MAEAKATRRSKSSPQARKKAQASAAAKSKANRKKSVAKKRSAKKTAKKTATRPVQKAATKTVKKAASKTAAKKRVARSAVKKSSKKATKKTVTTAAKKQRAAKKRTTKATSKAATKPSAKKKATTKATSTKSRLKAAANKTHRTTKASPTEAQTAAEKRRATIARTKKLLSKGRGKAIAKTKRTVPSTAADRTSGAAATRTPSAAATRKRSAAASKKKAVEKKTTQKKATKKTAAKRKVTKKPSDTLRLGGVAFKRGQRGVVDIPVGSLMNGEKVSLRATVLRGKRPGPTLGVFAAVHGDEINGVETIRRLLDLRLLHRLRGDVIAIPVVNWLGFLARSRYLPDRRDLNRLFPGSRSGSLGGRMARTLVREVLGKCTHVIDLHTGAVNRANLSQVRVSKGCPEDLALAKAFGAPVVIESSVRKGSLRATLKRRKIPALVFEGGEALRLSPPAVRFGVRGILSVMRTLQMLPKEAASERAALKRRVVTSKSTFWERVASGGMLTPIAELGDAVRKGQLLGTVSDPFGGDTHRIRATDNGIVIGRTNHALVDEGDAVFHLAETANLARAAEHIEQNRAALLEQPLPAEVEGRPAEVRGNRDTESV